MRTFGLTGGVASGKSIVAAHFATRGVAVLDADDLAREAVLPGSTAWQQIGAHFGPQVFDASGALQRELLAQRVFGAPEQLALLGRIVHPQVAQLFSQRARALEAQGQAWLCYCVPLLFENHLQDGLRPVVLVAARIETQVARARLRSGWTEEQTRARIAAQLPLSDKRKLADYVIENDGELSHTLSQADRVLDAIRACS
jgi:dephospho-CoA kinase